MTTLILGLGLTATLGLIALSARPVPRKIRVRARR